MYKPKSIVAALLLLLWAALLCFSVSFKAAQLQTPPRSHSPATSEEEVEQSQATVPVAWLEEGASHGMAVLASPDLLPLQQGLLLFTLLPLLLAGSFLSIKRRFSCLSEQFRILPNAP